MGHIGPILLVHTNECVNARYDLIRIDLIFLDKLDIKTERL